MAYFQISLLLHENVAMWTNDGCFKKYSLMYHYNFFLGMHLVTRSSRPGDRVVLFRRFSWSFSPPRRAFTLLRL